MQIDDIQLGPIRHSGLSQTLEARVAKFEAVFAEIYPQTHDQWIDGFLRDVHPESEIAIWESMASAYQKFTAGRQLSLQAKKELFGLLLVRSSADAERTLAGAELHHLSRDEAIEALRDYDAAPQPIVYGKN